MTHIGIMQERLGSPADNRIQCFSNGWLMELAAKESLGIAHEIKLERR